MLISKNVMEPLKEKLYLHLKNKEKTWKPSAACYQGPILEQRRPKMFSYWDGSVSFFFFFFCAYELSQRSVAQAELN